MRLGSLAAANTNKGRVLYERPLVTIGHSGLCLAYARPVTGAGGAPPRSRSSRQGVAGQRLRAVDD